MRDCASLFPLLLMNESCCHISRWRFKLGGHVSTKGSDDNRYARKTPLHLQPTHTHSQECSRTGQQSWRAEIPNVCPHCSAFPVHSAIGRWEGALLRPPPKQRVWTNEMAFRHAGSILYLILIHTT